MIDQEQIGSQQELLATYRRTLADLLKQQAQFGLFTPPYVLHDIRAARIGIQHCKEALRGWSIAVEDLPDDELNASGVPASASEQAEAGLTAIVGLLGEPAVRAALGGFQESFRIVCQQIDRLSNYKDLHDLLHDLQFNCYNPIVRGARDFPNNALFLESLVDYETELQQIINSLWEVAERAVFSTPEQVWIQQFSPTPELLRGAIESTSRELLNRAMSQIGRVLYVHPTRINARLKETARDLPLSSLIRAMASVQQYPARSDQDAEKLRQVGQGIAALEQLGQGLMQLIDEHDTWQELDLELHRIEEAADKYMQELGWIWPDVQLRIMPLCDGRSDRWTKDLQQASEKLDRALATQNSILVIAAFRPFRRQVGLCFFQADKKLKELCRSLRRVDGPLNSVMSMIA